MIIFKITLREVGSFINWTTLYGVADSIEEAMQNALKSESHELFGLEVFSAEAVAECSFGLPK